MRAIAHVSAHEAALLTVARALVSSDAYSSVEATLRDAVPVETMGRAAMVVLQDTLARGVVKLLARLGGARLRMFPDTRTTKSSRVFELRRPPNIAFSGYTFELVRWLTATPLTRRTDARFVGAPRTVGDELCALLALRLVESTDLERPVASSPGVRGSLAWLGFARLLARYGADTVPSFEPILANDDAVIVLECLGPELALRWGRTVTWSESEVLEAEDARRIVILERSVVDGFLDVVEASGRLDLATFLIEAGARALPRGAKAGDLATRIAPPVRGDGPLRARSESRRLAGALFHALVRLRRTRDALALVRAIDDDYAVAQALLASWEILSRDAFAQAEAVIRALGSLDEFTPEL